ncbi:MAG: glycosyltransferase [Anaerolineae bacterium]|nr:glycosyltransferase [Anaerolineae bacterium]
MVLGLPLSGLLLADSAFRALYLLLRLLDRRPSPNYPPPAASDAPCLAVVIAAHDEAAVIGATVRQVRQSDYPPDSLSVFVIADRCADATAQVARAAGARVWQREAGEARGKGAALDWFLRAAGRELDQFAALVILDADTQVEPTALAHLSAALTLAPVVQGFVKPMHADGVTVASLAALSEILSQAVDDTARVRLGWPVPLRGTGMALPPRLLAELAPRLRTRIEDTELSLLLAERGVRVAFAPDAVIGDPKPADGEGAARQRGRWLQGRVELLHRDWPRLLRLLLNGRPGDAALVLTLVLRPKMLVVALKAALAVGLTRSSLPTARRLGRALSAATAIDLLYYPLGLTTVDQPRVYARALLRAPAYGRLWLRGAWAALRSREAWLSARRGAR